MVYLKCKVCSHRSREYSFQALAHLIRKDGHFNKWFCSYCGAKGAEPKFRKEEMLRYERRDVEALGIDSNNYITV